MAALDVAIGNHDTNKLHGLPPFRGLAVQGSGFQGSIKDSSNLIERDDVLLEKEAITDPAIPVPVGVFAIASSYRRGGTL